MDYRNNEEVFREGMALLPEQATILKKAGAMRVGTRITPASDSLTYLQNFKQTSSRLQQLAAILKDHGLRLGLEYIGTQRNWTVRQHAFVHTMAETKELIAETGSSNIGFVLDPWHWWTAGESADDLRTLTNQDIISCDINDAPRGLERDDQYDNQRELPVATEVIDMQVFLEALATIGYDGPISSEPFSRKLNDMDNEQASRVSGEAMRNAVALLG